MIDFRNLKIKPLLFVLVLFSSVCLGQPQGQPSEAPQANGQQKWQVNFKDSDIQEVIKFVADVTGKTVIIDPRVKGRVKVISAEPMTEKALYDLFLSVLEIQGFTAVDVGGVVRILPRKDARTSAVPVTNKPELGNDAYITQVIQLYNVSAAKVLPVLRPLAPQHAHLAAYAPSNAIIISDTVANINRLRDVISRIDRAGVAETEIVELKYAQAEGMVKMLETLQNPGEKDAPANAKPIFVADSRSNSILVTGDDVRRQRVRELIKRLDIPRKQSGNVRVIYLEYADSEEVAKVLQKVVSNISKLDSAQGAKGGSAVGAANATVEADASTNSLLITADAATLESLLTVIERLDIRRAQVLVEAIIVEVTGDLNRRLGVEWAAFERDTILAGALPSSSILASAAAAAESGAVPAFSGLLLGGGEDRRGSGGASWAGIINALQANSEANILSTPNLLTTDNNTATISVGENRPFITGSFTSSAGDSTNPFQTIERRDVGINLSVTPQISEGNSVVLQIEQEVSDVNPAPLGATSDVVTLERKISTEVIAQDKEVIILGGLLEDQVENSNEKVPLLGDIPVLGKLFRTDGSSMSKRNLMVFLRATIIRDHESLRGATAEKYKGIRSVQLEQQKRGVSLLSRDVIPLLPVWDDSFSEQPSSGDTKSSLD